MLASATTLVHSATSRMTRALNSSGVDDRGSLPSARRRYNRTRLHSAIGYIAPNEMELKAA
jgi:hypothetical protein